MNDEYEYTKEDVERMLHFLSLHFPKWATPENAVKVLVHQHKTTKLIEEASEEELEALFQNLEVDQAY